MLLFWFARYRNLVETNGVLKYTKRGCDSKDDEKCSTDNSNNLFGQVFGQGGTARYSNSSRHGVGRNGTGGYAYRILCCGQGNGRQEGSISKFCRKDQAKNTQ